MSIYVFTNLATSLDGKISTKNRALFNLGSKYDHKLMDIHRARADGVLMGAGTLRAFKKAITIKSASAIKHRKKTHQHTHPINIILTNTLNFNPKWPFFNTKGVVRFLFIPKNTPQRVYEPYLETCKIFKVLDPDKNNSTTIISELKKQGLKYLLLEGGGGTLFPFVEKNLIDEWNITLTPKIVGGSTTPTLVDGTGFTVNTIKSFKLRSCRQVGDELYLQYTKKR